MLRKESRDSAPGSDSISSWKAKLAGADHCSCGSRAALRAPELAEVQSLEQTVHNKGRFSQSDEALTVQRMRRALVNSSVKPRGPPGGRPLEGERGDR